MNARSEFGESCIGPHAWPLRFAKEPEEEADYDELPETQEARPAHGSTVRRSVSPKQKKPSGGRPLILILLLLLIGGGAYAIMTPGALPPFLADLLGFGSPEAPGGPTPGTAAKLPTPGSTPAPQAPAPAAPSQDSIASPSGDTTAAAPGAPAPQTEPVVSAAPAGAIPSPAFGEGQMVFVALDPTLPVGMMVLSGDSVGSKPGPSVRPGAQVTVLDAEYMPNGWIYSVRTPDGSVGWISEKRLKVGR
jgi:hypothetical protein